MTTIDNDLALEANALATFRRNTADHKMTILHDQGIHRHLYFHKPGDGSNWSWHIVTWPGSLAIRGDIGRSAIFTREPDMLLDFFHGNPERISFNYWAEKTGQYYDFREYSPAVFLREVREQLAILKKYGSDLNHEEILESAKEVADIEDLARVWLRDSPDAAYFDTDMYWETRFDLWDEQFLFSCFAIAHAVRAYRAARKKAAA